MKNMYNENLNKKKLEVDDIISDNDKEVVPENNVKVPKISSSMKFYLFKKKFLKKNPITVNYTNVLLPENFLLKKK